MRKTKSILIPIIIGFGRCGNNVWKYDENGITNFYINKDKDGIFEHKVETDDVNCDGMIDVNDASSVLQAYSDLSTGRKTFLNYNLCDWDSNGIIDSSDASAILQKYAELSTRK